MDTMTTSSTEQTDPADDLLVMNLLQEHVPLALLCDLTDADGPSSREILDAEGEPVQRWWE